MMCFKDVMDAGDLPRYEFKDINIRRYMVFELSV